MSASKIARASLSSIIVMAMAASAAYADSINLTSASPGTTISSTATTTTANQGAKAFYESTNLDVLAGHSLTFNSTAGSSGVSLVHITGGQTNIGGNITSNAALWLWNGDGIVVHSGSTINAASLLLTTAGVTDPTGAGFLTNPTNTYNFNAAGNPTAFISVDHGIITATGTGAIGGDIIILAPQVTVENGAKLQSAGGQIQLLGGETMTADFAGDGLLNFAVINNPVTTKATNGATSTVEVTNGSVLHGGQVTVGVRIFQDAVLDHVINLGGQYEVGGYTNKATNPQHVDVKSTAGTTNVYEVVLPSPTATTTTSAADAVGITSDLTRSLTSLGDETVKDTTVNPNVSNVSYERPYRTNLANNVGNLNLLSPAAGGNEGGSPVSLGNLSPSAGGNNTQNTADNNNLGNLSPAAGGTGKAVNCGNSYLGNGWLNDPTSTGCAE